jgi:hypothetical protein
MNVRRFVPPARLAATLGAIVGLVAGSAAVAGAELSNDSPRRGQQIEATHFPPSLTLKSEEVTLSYEAFCMSEAAEIGNAGCRIEGTAFVRAAGQASFEAMPLAATSSATGRRLVAHVPEALVSAAGGLEYYAELRSGDGASISLPAGGASAPDRSLRVQDPVVVNLGTHVFGRTRPAAETVASTSWGAGPDDAGLEEGRNLAPIGATAFDVDRAGSVYVLDEARRRILRWDKGARSPKRIPVSVSGSLADMTVARDGSLYVLETVSGPGGHPVVRRFDADGRELERVETAERAASQIQAGRNGPMVLQQPSHQWMPIASQGAIVGPATQRANGQLERSLPGGGDVVVLRTGNELRVALTSRQGDRRSWVLRSGTPLGEVQLAEPLGNGLVVVARTYTDAVAEFDVILLDGRSLVRRFSVSAPEWAEAAPLGRFRVVGTSLYRLGSTEKGPFVDRFDLEVRG